MDPGAKTSIARAEAQTCSAPSPSTVAPAQDKAPKKVWTIEQTHSLIGIWQEVLVGLGHGNLRAVDLEQITASYNAIMGDNATRAQVENKITALKRTYQKHLQVKSSTGRGTVRDWEFFKEIDSFMGFKPKATGIPGQLDGGTSQKQKQVTPPPLEAAPPTGAAPAQPTAPVAQASPRTHVSQGSKREGVNSEGAAREAAIPTTPNTPNTGAPVSTDNSRDELCNAPEKEIPAAVDSKSLPPGVQGKRTAAGEASAKRARKSKARRHSAGGSGPGIAKALEGLTKSLEQREERRARERKEDKKADREFKLQMMQMQLQHQAMMGQLLFGNGQQGMQFGMQQQRRDSFEEDDTDED